MLFLTGLVGTGKSSLMHTMAEKAEQEGLNSAAWFFWRYDNTRNSKQRIIPTLAYQLGLRNPTFQQALHATIQRDPSILTKNMTQQISALIIKPWKAAFPSDQHVVPFVLFIDGLDECQSISDQRDILEGLVAAITLIPAIPIKVVLASRPEDFVRNLISPPEELAGFIHHIQLEDYDATGEIREYFSAIFRNIRQSHPARHATQLDDWPSKDDFEALVECANGHWIFADTVARYLISHDDTPVVRLQEILDLRDGSNNLQGAFFELDVLYLHILNNAASGEMGGQRGEDPRCTARVIWMAVFFQAKGTVSQIENHLGYEQGYLRRRLSHLGSLVSFSTCDFKDLNTGRQAEAVRVGHKSFTDFMLDPERCGPFFISYRSILLDLARRDMEWVADATEEGGWIALCVIL